ncbi:hypothetical protein BC939DRAFT_462292 [Gamsiella multidivaricata]|uniref:uncharacterized protein n=1 Tax=Gamsiella multidivaricata TaxID=101098 RepID=UPI00221E4EF5|nr:uncharacterized protein BC939DRAFT_462292 [Gamsiella multidivaricata]KAI7818744.1 hypothetical protein BC939DRAFT_462292 [Gamsiella multidivaricata]
MLWILWLYLCVSRILGQGTRMATTRREVYLLGIAQRYGSGAMILDGPDNGSRRAG